MKYSVTLNGAKIDVDVDGETVCIDGDAMRARLTDTDGGPVRILTLGESVYRVEVKPTEERGRYALWVDGFRFDVEALDERRRAIRELAAATAKAAGPAPLVAPMPGMIVRVQVTEGDAVQSGQGLVVMEAMKMENELRATSSATVKRVLVAAGTAVEKGALLLELE
jgi:biotin carboxyl carrier protein